MMELNEIFSDGLTTTVFIYGSLALMLTLAVIAAGITHEPAQKAWPAHA